MSLLTPEKRPPAPAQAPPVDHAEEAERWRALGGRDASADGIFYYAVRTTGVYCKPSCKARPALRKNVTFYASTAEAVAAGYRACKRCQPDRSVSAGAEAITEAARRIDAAIADEAPAPSLAVLARRVGFSRWHFQRLFTASLGLSPKAYADAARSRRLQAQLAKSASVTDAIHGAGYSSASRFYETAQARLGMTPSARRRGGQGEAIRYAISDCSLGRVLVAATDKGVCAIAFDDADQDLRAWLLDAFPNATLAQGDEAFEALVETVIALVETPQRGQNLPLDLRGTAFQERVWRALQKIPPGRTVTYAELAVAIGAPNSHRAVAGACAANKLAVVVPCHRVIRSDGGLSGYRWGVARKARLLQREGAR